MNDAKTIEITPVSRDLRVRVAAYLGVVCAYLAAVRGDPLTPLQLALFAGAAAWSLGFETRFPRAFFTPPVKIGLIGVGVLVFLAFVGTGSGSQETLANSIARFLFWNAIVFLLSRNKTEYDLWTIGIIDLSLFMISGAFVQPAAFLPLLGACLLANLYVFARVALLRCGPAGEKERAGVGVAIFQFVTVLEIAAIVFFFFPRQLFKVTTPKSPFPKDRNEAAKDRPKPKEGEPVKTGDADRTGIPSRPDFLSLTNYSSIKIDRTIVLRYQVVQNNDNVDLNQLVYLRGAILDRYSEGNWSADFRRQQRGDDDDGRRDGWTELRRDLPRRSVVDQKFWLQPLPSDLLFALPEPEEIELPAARFDPAGIVFLPAVPAEQTIYQVRSRVPDAAARLDEVRIARTEPRYLAYPRGLTVVDDIAFRETRGRTTVKGRVDALLAYLRRGFAYKIAPFVPSEGMDPVEYFLERKREGYCVHFASALALLCRAAGVPARVATGFHAKEYDAETASFVVRNSDAHAWVEVWYGPGIGWIPHDATPEEGTTPIPKEGDPVATAPKKDLPAPEPPGEKGRWDRFLVDFGSGDQGGFLSDVAAWIGGTVKGIGRFLARPAVWGTVIAALLLAVLFYAILPSGRKRRLRQMLGGFREGGSVEFYRDLLWILSKRGIRKGAGQTGWEFAEAARALCKDPGIDFVTERFYETRYGGRAPSPDQRGEIERVLARLAENKEPGTGN